MNTNKTHTKQLTQDAVMQSVLIKGLRINNYYELKGSVLGGGVCQLKNLNDFVHIGDLIEHKLVNPIPLTEEWLLKLGFKKDNKLNYVFNLDFNEGYEKITVELYKGGDNDFYFRGNILLDELKYVHQLQNLHFALTQRELTVA